MKITQDVEYTYDLGRNVTQVKFSDDRGWVYTETRTYARGYQLTDFSEEHATGVTVITGGSYTYDTNNNMTGTKKFSVYRQGLPLVQLAYRAGWTFTFDRNNRLKSHTHSGTDDVTHLWWDGLGRVWQRWDYDSGSEMWSDYLTRFVYDGGLLAQEHLFIVFGESSWDYTHVQLTHDYLRQPAGTRDRKATNGGYVDYFLLSDMGTISGRFTRGASVSLDKAQREIAGDRQARYSVAGGPPTTGDFTDVSNLGFASTYIESFGGTKSGDAQFFDALNQFGERHLLVGIDRWLTLRGNNMQAGGIGSTDPELPSGQAEHFAATGGARGNAMADYPWQGGCVQRDQCGCPRCCYEFPSPAEGCAECVGPSRPCWEFICCDSCPKANTLGIQGCVYERVFCGVNIDCEKECCDYEKYETCYEQADYGKCRDARCGGATEGSCWQQNNYEGPAPQWFFVGCTEKERQELSMAIEKMCRSLNVTGCMERCERAWFCADLAALCSCVPTPYRVECVEKGKGPHVYCLLDPRTLRVPKGWVFKIDATILLHEFVHAISCYRFRWTSEKQACGCEQACEDIRSRQGWTGEASCQGDPCCCRTSYVHYCQDWWI
jgi:hypothetical protein